MKSSAGSKSRLQVESPALAHFKRVDKALYQAGLPHAVVLSSRITIKRTNSSLFKSLASSVIGQQLSTRAAQTIRDRVSMLCGVSGITPHALEIILTEDLRAVGLSAAKIKTLKELSRAVLHENLNLLKLKKLPQEEIKKTLTSIWGIGPWTVQMFCIFSLGHPDVFSSGDLGLARGMELLYGLPKNSPRETLEEISEIWAPHRSYACLILWAHYDARKS